MCIKLVITDSEVFDRQAVQTQTWFIDDSVDLLHHIKVGLVVSVFDSGASPWHHRQLACRELFTNIGATWKTDIKQMENNKPIYTVHT